MRFRLANSGTGDSSGYDGMTNGMRNLFALPMMRAQGAEEAQTAQYRQQLMESQIADHMAQAALREQERKSAAGAGDVLDTVIASQAGTDVPTVRQWRDTMMRGPGNAAPVSVLPGETAPAPAPTLDPKIAQALGLQYSRMAPAMVNPKDFTVQGQSTASGNYQKQDAVRDIVSDPAKAALFGQAYSAIDGKPLVDNIGNTGVGFNKFTGAGTTIDPGLRVLFGNEVDSRVQENQAQAGSARAAAGAHGASAALSTARRDRVVGGYDKPVTVLDDETGDASVTRLPTGGDPVTIGLSPKKSTGVDATNAKERNRVVTAVEKELGSFAKDAEVQAEVARRLGRRGTPGKPAPAAAPAGPAAPSIDMGKAAQVKAAVKAGTLTREQGVAQLRALGFK